MFHTDDCIKHHAWFKEKRAEFEKQWPNYCQSCGGWGYTSSPGCSVPYGNTYVNLPDELDPCPDCAEEGKCPRCGAKTLNDENEYGHCSACEWDAKESEGLPEPPECLCFFAPENNPEWEDV